MRGSATGISPVAGLLMQPDPASTDMTPRSNEGWIAALREDRTESAGAVSDLQGYLRRVLGRMLRGRPAVSEVDDLVQESLGQIVKSLPSFRGDSAFTTWATGIATRVAFTELRRRRVRESAFDAFGAVEDALAQVASTSTPLPHESVERADVMHALRDAIATRITARQRTAILAELRGVPTVEIARRLGTNQNALYKLTHDARRKLRAALEDDGFGAESLLDESSGAPR